MKWQVLIGNIEFVIQGIVFLLTVAYFYWISKVWYYLQFPAIGFAILGSICLFFLEESPRLLHSKKKFDESRKVF